MMLAVIRIRGSVKVRKEIKDTLKMLRLNRVNHCVILEETPQNIGMVKKVQNYVTYGKIDDKVLKKLIEKRGKIKDIKQIKQVFRLNPPRKGFKSTRLPYPKGDLGDRKEKINELLERMI